MKIKVLNDDPYESVIENYLSSTFNKVITPSDKNLLNILTTILVGDKNIRLGSVPEIENLVEIRKVISDSIDKNIPIPILTAWGGRKTIATELVDTAELSAIHQLLRLDSCVKVYYPKGILVHIRIEDTGAYWLYRGNSPTVNIKSINKYSADFATLVETFRGDSFITPIRESILMDTNEYFSLSKRYSNVLLPVISTRMLDYNAPLSTESKRKLESIDWQGDIPSEQITHYLNTYSRLYPDDTIESNVIKLADYLGGAKARYVLEGRAAPADKYIGISFVPPIPGAPSSIFNTTLYYRTIPASDGRTHIAPWRAKGYLEISRDSVKAKLTHWSNIDILSQLNKASVSVNDIIVNTDYIVKD